ncbi:MAG: glutamine amidotransferase, partial [Trebonia sp.]
GHLVLLSAWPDWVLWLAIALAALLGWLIRSRLAHAAAAIRNWRAGVIWILQASLAALLRLLLWQPALAVAELKPQQNIIAVLVDDSQSMGIADQGAPRLTEAVDALQHGVLAGLRQKYQVRLYRLDSTLTRIPDLKGLRPSAPATHLGDSLERLAQDTADLPIGAVVLLSDGADNAGGLDLNTVAALRARHVPVHTVGFGREQVPQDVEVDEVQVAPRALADSRLSAIVRFHQRGYAGRTATLTIRDASGVLASRAVTFGDDGLTQSTTMLFNAGAAGTRVLGFSLTPQPGEANTINNAVTRLVNVDADRRNVLYVEGEPRWEYKFIRRAEDGDPMVRLASMLRTTQNKIYRQGVSSPAELAEGFPTRPEDLFAYQALIIGSVDATYFTPAQQDLIRQFVDRRGGGLLLLAGRASLADGGWGTSSLADLLPVVLPTSRTTFHFDPATAELAPAGDDSPITRLVDDASANAQLWKKLPYLMNYQEAGTPKPGAVVLANLLASGHRMPLLVTEQYGHGRTAVLASSGTWRWQMSLPVGDPTHARFWQQLVRWLVTDTPGPVVVSVPNQVLLDDGHVALSADVRGKDYQPAPDAHVEAHILGPGGLSARLDMTPVPDAPGTFHADWTADRAGSYLTEVVAEREGQELGRDVLTFQRMDGVAEHFHTGQNRDLLTRLASQTGGRYWQPADLAQLPSAIAFSDAGVSTRQVMDLWNMPIVFALLLLLKSAEWLLRRRWGIV